MATAVHVVRSGESLASIAKRAYGAEHLWPSIYAATNRLAGRRGSGYQHIANPNRIRVGDRLAMPEMPNAARRQMASDGRLRAAVPTTLTQAAPAGEPFGGEQPALAPREPAPPAATGGNPAATAPLAPFYGWIFKLDDIGLYETVMNGLKLTVKFKGDLTIQPRDGTPLVKLSNRDGELDLQREAQTVAGKLLTDYQFAFDGATGRLKFTCKMTQAGNAGAPDMGFGVPTPPDILQEFLKYKPFKGTLDGHHFLVSSFTVELTLSRDQSLPPSQPAPAEAPEERRRRMLSAINWNAVVLTALIGVLALGCFFFGGWALAAAAVFIGLGLGLRMWGHAEARERSEALTGARGPVATPDVIVLPEITVYGTRPP